MSRLDTQQTGPNVVVQAYKNLLQDYQLRAKQAEGTTAQLLTEKLGEDGIRELVNNIMKHMDERGIQKCDQYAGLIQTTLMSLNQLARETTDEKTKAGMVQIIQALTLSESR
jgi:hypothetical protein